MTTAPFTVRGATGDREIVVGLEVHAQVTSNAKLFIGAAACSARPPTRRSAHGCCHAGDAPRAERRCVRQADRTGSTTPRRTRRRFDRKNYFYADLP